MEGYAQTRGFPPGKKGVLFKNHYHIRFCADGNYHFQIYQLKNFATDLTGASFENIRNFIDTLKMRIGIA